MAESDVTHNPYYWGRKYRVLVKVDGGVALEVANSDWEPESLRVTFNLNHAGYMTPCYGDITIYNLTGESEQKLINEGSEVTVEAGYRDGHFGKIFHGWVLQPLRDRENVVDYTLTLHCVLQSKIYDHNLVRFTANAGLDQRGTIQQVSSNARYPIKVGAVTDNLNKAKLPRGKTFFGEPKKYYRQVAQNSDATCFVKDGAINFTKVTDQPPGEPLLITPKSGLIGTPQQIDYGCTFRTLLDPRIKITVPYQLAKIDLALIRQQKAIQGQLLTQLDKDRVFQICNVTYIGDTRGNDWYCDVIAYDRTGKGAPFVVGKAMS
jgi:hypothetical protein